MKRKILSLILVVAMLASVAVFAPTASATEKKATLAFGDAAGVAGDTVSVDFTVTTDMFQGVQFLMEYDASRLEFAGFEEGITWNSTLGTMYPADLTMNEKLKVYTQNGPYILPSCALGSAKDFSAGVVLATFTFTIKADAPAGDAYVNFALLADGALQPNKIETGAQNGSILKEEITFKNGTVTVLPEGYASAATVADDAWDFEDGVLYGCTDESLAEYTGAIVIPSEIGGEAVTTIASRAFEGYACSTIVIPASVTLLETAAVNACESLTKAYILGAETVLEDMAIGWIVTYRSNGTINATKTGVAVDEDDNVITTIYGAEGSTAQAYAELGDDDYYVFPFVAEAPYSLSYNGATYLVAAETKAPGSAVIDGQTVIAWTDGVNTYAPGADITLTESVALEPVTITAPVTSTEADFKLAEAEADLAMRFTATLSKADYAKLAALGTVEMGMLITPAAYVAKAGSFTKEALDTIGATNGAYVDVAVKGYYKETADDYILAGSLKGFSAKTLAKNPDFAAVVYATVTTAEGATFTVYGNFDYNANQNVKAVAEAIVETNITNTQKGWLNTLIGKFGA